MITASVQHPLRRRQQIAVILQAGVRRVRAADAVRPVRLCDAAADGLAYGNFTLDNQSRAFLLKNLPGLKDPLARGAAWVTLWEELLDGRVRPSEFLDVGRCNSRNHEVGFDPFLIEKLVSV